LTELSPNFPVQCFERRCRHSAQADKWQAACRPHTCTCTVVILLI